MKNYIKLSRWHQRASISMICGASLLVAPLAISQDDEEEEIFELSPFTVDGSQDQGYRATQTMAGTRIRTEMKDVGSAISVVTEEFMRDVGATDNTSLLVYTTNTEVSGVNGNFAGTGNTGVLSTDGQRRQPQSQTRVRGLVSAENTRNYFSSDSPWDGYNVHRVELQRGPNSVLFGIGSPGGVINHTTDEAIFSNEGEAQFQIGSHNSMRMHVNVNKVLIEDELAIRVAMLNKDGKYRQQGTFEDDVRFFAALKWDPKFLKTESSNASFAATFEDGNIEASRPRILPPIDLVTSWYEHGQETFDATTFQTIEVEPGSAHDWVGRPAAGNIYDNMVTVYPDSGSSDPSTAFYAARRTNPDIGDNPVWWTYVGVLPYPNESRASDFPDADLGVYKDRLITDRSVFDYYNHLIDGPNKSEDQNWQNLNLKYSQNFLDNNLGFELAYDNQDYVDEQTNLLSGSGQNIAVEVIGTLPNGDPNPNLGRPFVGSQARNNNYRNITREGTRFTAYYNVDFTDNKSDLLSNLLGRHSFTGLWSSQKRTTRSYSWQRSAFFSAEDRADGVEIDDRGETNIIYLGDSLIGRPFAGANIQPISATIWSPSTINIKRWNYPTHSGFDTIPLDLVQSNTAAGRAQLITDTSTRLTGNTVDSHALIWQGHFLNDLLVPMYGYRKDRDIAANAGDPAPGPLPGSADPWDRNWALPSGPNDVGNSASAWNSESGITRTWSVVLHAPDKVKEMLGGVGVSLFYNESENFEPDASRVDILANPIPSPSGTTEEMGITFSAFEDKLSLKINRYETASTNSSIGGALGGTYVIGASEAWGYTFAGWAQVGSGDFQTNYALVDPADADSGFVDPNITWLPYQPREGETVQTANARYTNALAALYDPANQLPDSFYNAWGIPLNALNPELGPDLDPRNAWNGNGVVDFVTPTGLAVTGDTVSKGTEFELFFNPNENFNLHINASKTEASRGNVAKVYVDWIESRYKAFNDTALGDVQLWGGNNQQETQQGLYQRDLISPYTLAVLQEGTSAPEIRPWRFNVIANYSFTDGKLKGFTMGGSYRWQDEIILGYPIWDDPGGADADGDGNVDRFFNVNDPYRGGSEANIDFWSSYSKPLNDKIDWRIQLNIQNAFASKELIPISVQPDGTVAGARIAPQTTWALTNTFSF